MFTIRGLLFLTLSVACITTLAQFGRSSHTGADRLVDVFGTVLLNLVSFWSILRWISEVERVRCDHQKYVVLFADSIAFVLFASQLAVTGYVLGVSLPIVNSL